MASELAYNYTIEMTFLNGKKEVNISSEAIKSLVISYDYMSQVNAPIVFAQVNFPIATYNKMQKNRKNGKVLLEIKKFNRNKSGSTKKVYIRKQLAYFFPNGEYDDDSDDKDMKSDTAYRISYIGMIDPDIIDDNKRFINKLFKNTNPMTMIHYYTRKFKMIIEPFDYNKEQSIFYIPPITGVSSMIDFINNMASFYTTDYRYFRDFKRGYLLSNKGKGININDGTYPSVHINIEKQKDNDNANMVGFIKDKDNECYLVEVNTNQYTIDVDKLMDYNFNQYIGVNYEGGMKKIELDVNPANDSKVRPRMIRVFNKNTAFINNMANGVNINEATVTISKGDLDCSLIEPHKEFIIHFPKSYSSKNGKYILTSKKELFSPNEDDFCYVVNAGFRKVNNK